jgi:hypothetical protein
MPDIPVGRRVESSFRRRSRSPPTLRRRARGCRTIAAPARAPPCASRTAPRCVQAVLGIPTPRSCTTTSTIGRPSARPDERSLPRAPGVLASTAFNSTLVSARPNASTCPAIIGTSSATLTSTGVSAGTALRVAEPTRPRPPALAALRATARTARNAPSPPTASSPSPARRASRSSRGLARAGDANRIGVNRFLARALPVMPIRAAPWRAPLGARPASRISVAISRIRLRRTTNSGAPFLDGPPAAAPRPIVSSTPPTRSVVSSDCGSGVPRDDDLEQRRAERGQRRHGGRAASSRLHLPPRNSPRRARACSSGPAASVSAAPPVPP